MPNSCASGSIKRIAACCRWAHGLGVAEAATAGFGTAAVGQAPVTVNWSVSSTCTRSTNACDLGTNKWVPNMWLTTSHAN